MTGPGGTLGYRIEGLRAAAGRQDGGAVAASSVADLLSAVEIDTAMLGGVPSAAGFVDAALPELLQDAGGSFRGGSTQAAEAARQGP